MGQPAIRIFCKRIIINQPACLNEDGPLLLACNHPNSFLDAVLLDLLMKQPVYSLARGDAFINRLVARIFYSLHILPVYRTSEGVENLSENYKTFDNCLELFRHNGTVLMFSEGKCINEWHLRPLKKGTARLAIQSWKNDIPLKVLPVGLNYDSFSHVGKTVKINFGKVIRKEDIDFDMPEGLRHQAFNTRLANELKDLVYEIGKDDKAALKKTFGTATPFLMKVVLGIPALAGYLIHAPVYLCLRYFINKKYHKTDHFDSVMIGSLLFSYPLYVILLSTCCFLVTASYWAWLCLLLLPFTAWSYIQLKDIHHAVTPTFNSAE